MTGLDWQQEKGLLERAMSGEQDAVNVLLLVHYTPLEKYIEGRLSAHARTHIEANDILQEACSAAMRDLKGFRDPQPGAFFAWLKVIAEHRILDALKSQNRKKRGGEFRRVHRVTLGTSMSVRDVLDVLAADEDTPSRIITLGEAKFAIEMALRELPADHREAFQRRYLDGMSIDETATAMSRSPGAVRGLVDRAKEKMRTTLGRMSHYISHR